MLRDILKLIHDREVTIYLWRGCRFAQVKCGQLRKLNVVYLLEIGGHLRKKDNKWRWRTRKIKKFSIIVYGASCLVRKTLKMQRFDILNSLEKKPKVCIHVCYPRGCLCFQFQRNSFKLHQNEVLKIKSVTENVLLPSIVFYGFSNLLFSGDMAWYDDLFVSTLSTSALLFG